MKTFKIALACLIIATTSQAGFFGSLTAATIKNTAIKVASTSTKSTAVKVTTVTAVVESESIIEKVAIKTSTATAKSIGKKPTDLMEKVKVAELPSTPINSKYAGTNHPTTDVPYNKKGFPEFKSKYTCNMGYTNAAAKALVLSVPKAKLSGIHINKCKQQLAFNLRTDTAFQQSLKNKGLNNSQINELKQGRMPRSPDGTKPAFTFHHNEKNGNILELVDYKTHAGTKHNGGVSTSWDINSLYWKARL